MIYRDRKFFRFILDERHSFAGNLRGLAGVSNILILLLFLCAAVSCSKSSKDEGCSLPLEYTYFEQVTAQRTITKQQFADMIAPYVKNYGISSSTVSGYLNDVHVAAITYKTKGVDGKEVTASGVVAYPAGTKSYDHLVSIQHGTLDIDEAPSTQNFEYELAPVLMGHVVVMADYLGYGASKTADLQHPYLHIKSTGIVCADMIEAAREYLKSVGIKENSTDLQLIGYSQGGTSTVALLMELESRGVGARVKAAHAGGGVYDMEATWQYFMSQAGTSYAHMGYIPFLIRGICYGEQLTLDDSKVYAQRMISQGLVNIFSTKQLSEWHSLLGTDITKVLNADAFAYPTFNGNTEFLKLYQAFKKNSLINYPVSQTAFYVYHTRTDDYVPYVNATSAVSHWPTAHYVELTSTGHFNGGVEFYLRYMGLWNLISNDSPAFAAKMKEPIN
ncbi:MAG: hypothetical protein LKM33_06040 [Bacteroidales bacterium]|jgi:pimeloyl-ACP methyl ester carboxylesterase|nr:hypothetical protein [Bacteroidales bacterium]